MPRPPNGTAGKIVTTIQHDEARRKNIPTAEYPSVLEKQKLNAVRVAYPRTTAGKAMAAEKDARNTDLDPQLVWRGKDRQDWADLVVHVPPHGRRSIPKRGSVQVRASHTDSQTTTECRYRWQHWMHGLSEPFLAKKGLDTDVEFLARHSPGRYYDSSYGRARWPSSCVRTHSSTEPGAR